MYYKFSLEDERLEDLKKGKFVVRFLRFEAPFKSDTEVHRKVNDVYIVYSGKAKVLLSENFIGGKEIEVDELRGCEILNPTVIELKNGDVLFISAGTAHQLMVEEGILRQVIIKIPEV